jgi:hypothetical protein
MDLDLAKELSHLQEKKLALEAGTELMEKCDTIVELDRRVGLLSHEVQSLHDEVEQRFNVDDICEQLSQPYRVLNRTSIVSDLIIALTRLNLVCRRIDTDPNLVHSEDGHTMSLKLNRFIGSGADDELGDEKSTIMHVSELLEEYESNYKPFEQLLSNRSDLPYVVYATKVRTSMKSLEKLKGI